VLRSYDETQISGENGSGFQTLPVFAAKTNHNSSVTNINRLKDILATFASQDLGVHTTSSVSRHKQGFSK